MSSHRHSRQWRTLDSTFSTPAALLCRRGLEISIACRLPLESLNWYWPCFCKETKKQMFKLSIIDTDQERRLLIQGRLVQPWVTELQRIGSTAGNSLEGRTLVIDLTDATSISRDGEDAILELMREGARFSCADVLTKHLIEDLAHRCNASLENVLSPRRCRSEQKQRR